MKTKVLHVLSSRSFSGAENVVCQIISMFCDDDKIDMAYASPNGQISEALKQRGIKYFPMDRLSKKELNRVIAEYSPDIVHAHDISAGVIASAAGKRKLICTVHGNHTNMRGVNLKSLLFLLASTRFSHIFWVSRSALLQYRFKRLVNHKSSVLYNVLDRDKLICKMEQDEKDYSYDIAYIGRLSKPKDPLRLIRVIAKATSKMKEVRAAVVGKGELEEQTKAAAEEQQLENVSFLGYMDNPLKLLRDSKVMIMTSIYEGTPMCALEAMALGVPIVSVPTDGMCDLIIDGQTGYLSDDDDVLAERIVQIIKDQELHRQLSECSVKRFLEISDINKYKQSILEAYIN